MGTGIASFVIGVILGAAALWIAAHFVIIPGIKATNTSTTNAGQSVQTQPVR